MEDIVLIVFFFILGLGGIGMIIFGFVGFFINWRLKKKGMTKK